MGESSVILIVGVLLVVGLQLLSCVRIGGGKRTLFVLMIGSGAILGSCVVTHVGDHQDLVSKGRSSIHSKYFANMIKDIVGSPPDNLVFILGGSYAARGIDWMSVERDLTEMGFSVRIVPMMIPGANHFERLSILRKTADMVGDSWSLLSDIRRVWVLDEICVGYDKDPVNQLDRTPYSDASLDYMSPDVALRAVLSILSSDYSSGKSRIEQIALCCGHGGVNLLNIGIWSRVTPMSRLPAWAPRSLLDGAVDGFRFSGLSSMWESIDSKAEGGAVSIAWKRRWVDSEYRKIMPIHTRFGYFTVPTLSGVDFVHEAQYWNGDDSVILSLRDGSDRISVFNDASVWYDNHHLNSKGAGLYSDWFVGAICRENIVQK